MAVKSPQDRLIKFWIVQSLTFSRLVFILIYALIALLAPKGGMWFGLALFLIIASALTDLVDGPLARRWKVSSRFGAYADPFLDKVFYLVTLPVLIYLSGLQECHTHTRLLVAFAILFLLRDMYISFLRSIGALYQADARANWSGKARTLISFPVIVCVFYHLEAPANWSLQLSLTFIYVLEILGIIINLISIQVYTSYYWPWLKKELDFHIDEKND